MTYQLSIKQLIPFLVPDNADLLVNTNSKTVIGWNLQRNIIIEFVLKRKMALPAIPMLLLLLQKRLSQLLILLITRQVRRWTAVLLAYQKKKTSASGIPKSLTRRIYPYTAKQQK
jgi:hypothetical protein